MGHTLIPKHEGPLEPAFIVHKFGLNASVGTSLESVWTPGGLKTYVASAEPIDLVSSSPSDTTQTIIVDGIGADGSYVRASVQLNGTSTVSLPTNMKRVMRASPADDSVPLAGDVTITHRTSAVVAAFIEGGATGPQQTEMAMFTCPAGYIGYVQYVYAVGTDRKDTRVSLYLSKDGSQYVWKRKASLVTTSGRSVERTFASANDTREGLEIPAGYDFELRAVNIDSGGGTANVHAEAYVIFYRDHDALPHNAG